MLWIVFHPCSWMSWFIGIHTRLFWKLRRRWAWTSDLADQLPVGHDGPLSSQAFRDSDWSMTSWHCFLFLVAAASERGQTTCRKGSKKRSLPLQSPRLGAAIIKFKHKSIQFSVPRLSQTSWLVIFCRHLVLRLRRHVFVQTKTACLDFGPSAVRVSLEPSDTPSGFIQSPPVESALSFFVI